MASASRVGEGLISHGDARDPMRPGSQTTRLRGKKKSDLEDLGLGGPRLREVAQLDALK